MNFRAKTSVELFLRAKIQKLYFRHLNFRAKNDIVTDSNQNIWIFAPKKISDFWRENSKMLLSYLSEQRRISRSWTRRKFTFNTSRNLSDWDTHTGCFLGKFRKATESENVLCYYNCASRFRGLIHKSALDSWSRAATAFSWCLNTFYGMNERAYNE